MKSYKTAMKALGAAVVAVMVTACGSGGTSKSSNYNQNSPPPNNNPAPTDLTPVVLTHDNFSGVASQALKSLLLNDAGSNALNKTVTITTDHNLDLVNKVSGLILTFAPYPCSNGGDASLKAVINNSTGGNGNIQLDLNRPLQMSFNAEFRDCDQAGNVLDGDVALVLNANITQLLNATQYNFDSRLDVSSLGVIQPNLPSFTFDGSFQYNFSSEDGNTVNMELVSNNIIYFADENYQMLDFSLSKTVNNATQEYHYFITSEFTDSSNPSAYVAYETVEPLVGKGFTLPDAGQLAVQGANGTVYIHALAQEKLLLKLDLDNDGAIDEEHLTTWQDLVLSSFNVQQ
jgi:hypothetical protein